ncbi:lysozyme inhibitor LprI family protein [Chromobacterium subtsugae]|uniref:lysozyme inhibitor LprI family protein n=1 Tax=Chromobacterium subtsugae TaxID=251747 RepID=UPI000640F97A|nr:lysozyme inhibitor LprI family protein [Chromobacterium subtsugae]
MNAAIRASRLALPLMALLAAVPARAMDCAAPRLSGAETWICATPALLMADMNLNDSYRIAALLAPSRPALRREQQAWLRAREQCRDQRCLRQSYVDRARQLRARIRDWAQPCAVDPRRIVGDWESIRSGTFDQFQLAPGHRFHSWLHQRPEFNDKPWTFAASDCRLSIGAGRDGTAFAFLLAQPRPDRLILIDPGSLDAQLYKKLR